MLTIKYVVVKTLTEKKQPITQTRRAHYPIWAITPRLGTNTDARVIARFHYSVHERSADTVKLEK